MSYESLQEEPSIFNTTSDSAAPDLSASIIYPHAIARSDPILSSKSTFFGSPSGKVELRLFYNEPTWVHAIQYTLLFAKWPFELNEVDNETWMELNACGAILEAGGFQIRQATGILRYCGKLTKQYPDDPYEALLCDEIIYHIRDFKRRLSATIHKTTLLNNLIYVVEGKIKETSGKYAVGDRISTADMEILSLLQWAYDGKVLGCPPNAFEDCQEIMKCKRNLQSCEQYKDLPRDIW